MQKAASVWPSPLSWGGWPRTRSQGHRCDCVALTGRDAWSDGGGRLTEKESLLFRCSKSYITQTYYLALSFCLLFTLTVLFISSLISLLLFHTPALICFTWHINKFRYFISLSVFLLVLLSVKASQHCNRGLSWPLLQINMSVIGSSDSRKKKNPAKQEKISTETQTDCKYKDHNVGNKRQDRGGAELAPWTHLLNLPALPLF